MSRAARWEDRNIRDRFRSAMSELTERWTRATTAPKMTDERDLRIRRKIEARFAPTRNARWQERSASK